MMRHLLWQVAAPIMACGNEQARKDRPTDEHPRKAAVLGHLGAAAGKLRSDPWHTAVSKALGFSVLVLRPGKRFSDYHTVLTPKKGKTYITRAEEVADSDYTVETVRDYISDAYFAVALWTHPGSAEPDFEELAEALDSPVFEPYAGRKCCTLSLPPAPLVVDTPTLREAFLKYRKNLFMPLLGPGEAPCRVYWEPHPASGLDSVGTRTRQDGIADREKRLFYGRSENEGSLRLFEAAGAALAKG